jgi:DNA-binding NtrC family response regulator
VLTATDSSDAAALAIERGARDFVAKPWEEARLLSIVRTQVALARALRRQSRVEAENRSFKREGCPSMIAEAPSMRPVLDLIARVGPSEANVLITGENGTGKSLVAQALHSLSPRAAHGFVAMNAGGLGENLFESELFGHVNGVFADAPGDRIGRLELADGGTLFFEEIANLPTALQPKLLRVVERGEFARAGSNRTRRVTVRVVSATNADLAAEAAAGRFRQDLLLRLNTIEIRLPPLRDRREDIPALASHFLRLHARRHRRMLLGFDAAALHALLAHRWPGNLRELDHVVERGVLMADGSTVGTAELGLGQIPEASSPLEDMNLEEVEGFLIRKAMSRFEGNVSRAAKALGLSRSALYRRLERFGL